MNILHLMKDYKPTIGGSVVRNSNMLENYVKQSENDRIIIINLDGGMYDDFSYENGIRVYRTKRLSDLIKLAGKIIREENVEIIHAHNFRFLFAAFAAKFLSKKRVSIFVEIHAMYNMSWYKEALSRLLLQKVDGIIVLAECAKEYITDEYDVPASKIKVIRNGVDSSDSKEEIKDGDFKSRILELKEKNLVVLYSGSFYEWQGVNFIADEFDNLLDRIPSIAIIMVGDGPDFEYVENKYNTSRNKARILLHNGISKQEILSLYDLTDILIIPRLKNLSTNTAVPLKVIEAMEHGKCIVSANDNGLKEVLNENNAFIFESGNITSLIDKLKEVVNNENHRKMISSNAAADAESLFITWEESAKNVSAFYHRRETC